ncbi:uncharacterized protein [Rutidosis leptorrhynchoides]|uniref:uncharacterized protein n=1 Tax=Rutidosis leptorrhynchoides TaxID=125765 RepID=UPI003A99F34C
MDFKAASWNIRGMSSIDKQDEVIKFIKDEKLCICTLVETHLKPDNISKVCDRIFGVWKWYSNIGVSPNSCRIIVGWDPNKINVMFIQVVRVRRDLWKDIRIHATIANGVPWVLMGDFNTTKSVNEHSSGGSYLTEDFGAMYPQAFGMFLPYMVSDQSPSVLHIPNSLIKKKRSFRFMNHLANKDEFLFIVEQGWKRHVEGHKMFQIVSKLKLLKEDLNKLNWNHGNIFNNVKNKRDQLSVCQASIDSNPHDQHLKDLAVKALNEYENAKKDEYVLLQQKIKIKWLGEGDRNTSFFHSMLKSRKAKNRIDGICDEQGSRHEGDQVADQFVEHFKRFLGSTVSCRNISELGDIFTNTLSSADADDMVVPVTDS